jgi:hypothetical protein
LSNIYIFPDDSKEKEFLVVELKMVKQTKQSIWGKWWTEHRAYAYPAWLIYEASARFYDYAQWVHNYFEKHYENLTPYLGDIGAHTLDILCSSITFVGCSTFLTIPASLALYKFFKEDNLTNTKLEEKIKRFL